MQKKNGVLDLVKEVLAEITFNDPRDFQPQSVLTTELNLTSDDIVAAAKKIAAELSIDSSEIIDVIKSGDITTVEELADAINTEVELG
jgi:uncharacterized protein YdaT